MRQLDLDAVRELTVMKCFPNGWSTARHLFCTVRREDALAPERPSLFIVHRLRRRAAERAFPGLAVQAL